MTWTPTDYMRDGIFCPPHEFRRLLNEIAAKHSADVVICLATHRTRLFRTLINAAGPRKRDAKAIRKLLTDGVKLQRLNEEVALNRALDSLKGASTFGEFCRCLDVEAPQRFSSCEVAVTVHESGNETRACIALVGPSPKPLGSGYARSVLDFIGCTVQVRMRSQDALEQAVDRAALGYESETAKSLGKLNSSLATSELPAEPHAMNRWDPTPGELFCSKLLGMLVGNTGSLAASFFGLERDQPGTADAPIASKGDRRHIAGAQARQAVDAAFSTHLPFVRNTLDYGDGKSVYIAYPVTDRRFNSRAKEILGVILLARTPEQVDQPYTRTHLQVLSIVANQIRRNHDWLLLRESTALLRHGPVEPVRDGTYNPEAWKNYIQFSDPEKSGLSVLPVEARMQEYQMLATVVGLYKLTRSRSVALRFLTTDGRYLVRCLNIYGLVGGENRSQRTKGVASRSPNAWVVDREQICHIYDLRDKEAWKYAHDGLERVRLQRDDDKLRSLYCTPIRCNGRVVGTLNAESVYAGAFAASEYLIEAIAAHIGWLMEQQQSYNERLLQITSPVGSILHVSEQVKRAIGEISAASEDLHYLQDPIQRIESGFEEMMIAPAQVPHEADQKFKPPRLFEIVRACEQASGSIRFRIVESPAMQVKPVGGQAQVEALRYCLSELMSNALRYKKDSEWVTVSATVRRGHGRQWVRLALKNLVDKENLPTDSLQLARRYGRQAVERDGSIHWGALSIGATVRRQLSGDLFLDELASDQLSQGFFKAILEIPIPEATR